MVGYSGFPASSCASTRHRPKVRAGGGQEILQTGKQEVGITAVEPVGTYAVRLVFSDGHDTGLYSWDYLHDLGMNQNKLWEEYLERLAKAGSSREPGDAIAKSATSAPVVSPPGAAAGWKKL
jgi:DUF971 family protein